MRERPSRTGRGRLGETPETHTVPTPATGNLGLRAGQAVRKCSQRTGAGKRPARAQCPDMAAASLRHDIKDTEASHPRNAEITALLKQTCFALAMARCTSRSVTATSSICVMNA